MKTTTWMCGIACLLLTMPTILGAQNPPAAAKASGKVIARFTTTEGNFAVRLFQDETPKTVANFIGLAEGTKPWTDPKTGAQVKKPYYNGLIFHRVIENFMIQGGDPLGNGTGGPGFKFADEFSVSQNGDAVGNFINMIEKMRDENDAESFRF